jgi:hypothetical protein
VSFLLIFLSFNKNRFDEKDIPKYSPVVIVSDNAA